MYNTDIPTRAELPTTKQLLRSTAIAIVSAGVILTTIVLPAEYAIDPTGIGKAIGLAEMGEIKTQLAAEAESDRIKDEARPAPAPAAPDQRSSLLGSIFAELVMGSAAAQEAAMKSEETKVTLKPGEGAEVKLDMKKGAKANFTWTVEGGVVNFDMHADGAGQQSTSYEKGRAAPSQEGVLEAAFDGKHGWFWRNRGKADVTVTLKVNGDFAAMKRVM
ncbi:MULTISPECIES: transmembrane anchor protein [Hansschlegelia]|uniref:Transmembrane anchor protein n=1 Tax=Hansschlegelia zhihuaiae TaxID=405005 RepID=A0A4Q0MEW1_9HYPH|nr:transmembrane anchor protein [Hansschlegelia zhihuaiae]RXF71469.1 transmembrane anchor protein [Hansschlegelia zhihuaiae]